ncbi:MULTISPECIES: ABC transporter permease [Rhizobium]|jgi:simple sugar transport system permease protein|uniref:Simple sugar transport system permease protein n=1 Tax=Rhizobium miluonense TaxID=411945 RepID=A0ABU1SUP1_9HYPH|nr:MULTISPECIES: ABC transporter permease [Rhizobium]MBB3384270.1 simple sugar transport system permease protein [Rhizobium sp. BK098]MBB3569368.1 simple sugar transport system permease protein [Rhizobium sp. BK491]MBB3615971.1 simple sugar transport system permease protein [Rhizobium sp. BK609]MBB3681630.1 simple sugar transport system permease protein [Rhizobium sp. BK612]MDR6902686.1 simple sugar transport system permease protein [Rhizobium miluonense]
MSTLVDIIASAGLWAAVLRIATPLIFGTLGALLCERAGVLNLGIEGIMTFGAMIGWLSVYHGADLWTGLLIAAIAGGIFGLLHSALTVTLGLSQHVSGLGVTLFASSFSYYVFRLIVPVAGTPPTITPFQPIAIPGLSTLPFIGPALFTQTAPTYFAILVALVMAYLIFRTPAGLAIRMTGENPHAAEAQGLNPMKIRYGAIIAGSALMGMGGAFLTLSAFNSFFPTMVQGRGWICIALVVFSSWRPGRALFGALLFAFFDAFQLRLQTAVQGVPYQIFLMTPYILSIVALAVMSRRARVPQALMQPYRRGER